MEKTSQRSYKPNNHHRVHNPPPPTNIFSIYAIIYNSVFSLYIFQCLLLSCMNSTPNPIRILF